MLKNILIGLSIITGLYFLYYIVVLLSENENDPKNKNTSDPLYTKPNTDDPYKDNPDNYTDDELIAINKHSVGLITNSLGLKNYSQGEWAAGGEKFKQIFKNAFAASYENILSYYDKMNPPGTQIAAFAKIKVEERWAALEAIGFEVELLSELKLKALMALYDMILKMKSSDFWVGTGTSLTDWVKWRESQTFRKEIYIENKKVNIW